MFTLAIFVEKKVYKDYKVEHASKHIPNKIWKLKNKKPNNVPHCISVPSTAPTRY